MIRSVLLAFALPAVSLAQGPATPSTVQGPTSKVLAIGHLVGAPTATSMRSIMPQEVQATVQLYLDGKIDQWFARKDQNGVVFLMNVPTVEEAHTLLEALPLGVAKRMEFELIPLGPLSPLRYLLSPRTSAAQAVPGAQQ